MITILGPTASGKTRLAVSLAIHIDGEIISADSRQVYRGMNLGTGKDLEEYTAGGIAVPIHLIDLRDPGYEYNIYEFREDFYRVYPEITGRKKVPVLCGGSGMYLETVLLGYELPAACRDEQFIRHLDTLTDGALEQLVKSIKPLHNKTDLEDRGRMIKAILVARGMETSGLAREPVDQGQFCDQVFGIRFPRDQQMRMIEERLEKRLKAGMADEVKHLLDSGIPAERLIRYGLEYRYITLYLTGQMDYATMKRQLNIAIRQFAKRQMTWFRRMERSGVNIQWIDGMESPEEQLGQILQKLDPGRT
jgi:tRNA dimethylallyltransferase